MNCSCHTTALRIFVRTIAQIQVPTATPAGCIVQRPFPFEGLRPFPATSRQLFHTTSASPSQASSVSETTNQDEVTAPSKPVGSDGPDPGHAAAPSKSAWTTLRKKALSATQAGNPQRPRKGKPKPRSGDTSELADDEGFRKLLRGSEEKRRPSLLERIAEEHNEGRDTENWKSQKAALKKKFPEGWKPRKRLSPDALAGIRALHAEFPQEYTSEVLANKFEVSPEAIRRILRSKWNPSPDEEIDRQERWFKRGQSVWSRWAAMGVKPPRKWRAVGIVRDPIWNEKKKKPEETEAKKARARAHNLLSETLI